MKKNEFRVKKTFERPIKNVETFKTSIEKDYQKYVNDSKQDKKTPMRVIASILAIIALICLFTIDNDTIVGFICLAPATFYALSYFTGERFSKDLFGMTNTLLLSGIWVFNALIWFL
jgi:hypothetical protein